MKTVLKYLLLIMITGFTFIGCKKEQNNVKYVTLDVTLARGTNYNLDLRQYGDADDIVSITKQADDYITSEISRDASTSWYIYKYSTAATPKVSSTGHDTVVLKITEPGGRGRCGKHQSETDITIHFTLQ